MATLMVFGVTTAVFGAGRLDPTEIARLRCHDEESCTPLCTNQYGLGCCHWENIHNVLRWQQSDLKEGLDNYLQGDPAKLMTTVYYLSAYARKLERAGRGYEAATNAYCALMWQQRSAIRGNNQALLACYCCFASGGALGRHGDHAWGGPPSCYSLDLHDVPVAAMGNFEPAPEYLVDEVAGRKRYIRVYEQDTSLAKDYLVKSEPGKWPWHTKWKDCGKCMGWHQPSDSIEIVKLDSTGIDVRAHVESVIKAMDVDMQEAIRRDWQAREKIRLEKERLGQ